MDETQATPALNENVNHVVTVAEASNVEASPAPEPTTSEPTPTEPTTDTPTDDTAVPVTADESVVEPERQQVRPAQRRIQELVAENKQLKDLYGSPAATPTQPLQSPKLSQLLQGRDSIDPAELDSIGEELVAQAANGIVDLKVTALDQKYEQREALSNLEADTKALEDLPELKDNPKLEAAIANTWKKLAVKQNPYNPTLQMIDPSIRLSEVAKDFIEAAQATAEISKASITASVADLADNTAITPNSDAPVEKAFKDLSLKEMEARLKAKGHDV